MGWVKTQPEAFLADPTRTIILSTQATRGIILSNTRDQNLTASWFDMHCSTIFANDFLHALLHHPTIPWILILFCQSQSKLTEKWEKNFTRAWPEPNFTNLSWDPTQARSDNPKPDLRPEKRTRPIPSLGCIFFGILDYKKNLMKFSKILFWSAYDTNLCISLFAAWNMKMHSISMLLLNSFLFHYWIIGWNI